MKTPYWLAENGYIPDPENELRFTNPNGHPFYTVEFENDRQHNQGECLEAMLKAAHSEGYIEGAAAEVDHRNFSLAEHAAQHKASMPLFGSFTIHLEGKDMIFECPEKLTPETREIKRLMEEKNVAIIFQPWPDRVGETAFHAIHNAHGEIVAIARQRPDSEPPEHGKDLQCDGCRWMKKKLDEVRSGAIHPDALHCLMHRQRVENCQQQEIEHPRKK